MDSAGSAGVSAAGLHRRHTPNRQNGASAMNPNADDGETPNLGIDPMHTQRSRALDIDADRHCPQRKGKAGRGGFARTFGTFVRSDVPCCPGPGNEQRAGFGRTCRAVRDRATSSAPVRHIGALRRLATSVRGWFRMPGWSPGQRRRTGLGERKPAATAPQGGSRPIGAQSVWPSIPVDRWPQTAVCAQVMGGHRTFHAETAVGWRQR